MSNNSKALNPQPPTEPPAGETASIYLEVDDQLRSSTPAVRLVMAAQETLRLAGVAEAELTLVVTTDEALRQLNLAYRGMDAPTDVLSFPTRESDQDGLPSFVTAPELDRYLGDVVISYAAAARQAAAAGHETEDELCLLAVHGTLHLLGFDHGTAEEEAAMWQAQEAVLARLGLSIPVPRYLASPDSQP